MKSGQLRTSGGNGWALTEQSPEFERPSLRPHETRVGPAMTVSLMPANIRALDDSLLVFTGFSASVARASGGPDADLHWPMDGLRDLRAQQPETEVGRGLCLISNASLTDG